jgi:hypothetical protein
MMWQTASDETRTRFHVADLIRAGSSVALFYNWSSPDFWTAVQNGFQGHPAFGLGQAVHHNSVIEVMSKRLPPRSRNDFALFLYKHGLSNNPQMSDFALIGYTGGRLPADGFSFEIDFSIELAPYEFHMEVAGFRYYEGMKWEMDALLNQPIQFVREPTNPHDTNAVQIFVGQTKIGYVPRSYAPWLGTITNYLRTMGVVSRIEGSPVHPHVYVYLSIARETNQTSLQRQRALF